MFLRHHPIPWRLACAVLVCVGLLVLLPACGSAPPKDAFQLSATSLEDRQLQSRRFDTTDQKDLLAASVGVLQDLGYALDVSNADLGVLTASKELDATNAGQIASVFLLSILTQGVAGNSIDKNQKVRVCLVVNQSLENTEASVVRITISRVIWNTMGQVTRAETLSEPELYQTFFQKISKASFLQAHDI